MACSAGPADYQGRAGAAGAAAGRRVRRGAACRPASRRGWRRRRRRPGRQGRCAAARRVRAGAVVGHRVMDGCGGIAVPSASGGCQPSPASAAAQRSRRSASSARASSSMMAVAPSTPTTIAARGVAPRGPACTKAPIVLEVVQSQGVRPAPEGGRGSDPERKRSYRRRCYSGPEAERGPDPACGGECGAEPDHSGGSCRSRTSLPEGRAARRRRALVVGKVDAVPEAAGGRALRLRVCDARVRALPAAS